MPDDRGLRLPERVLGRNAALFLSLGAIIGSGWLFASLDGSQFSGGGTVLAWVIAALFASSLAVVYAELGSMFPVDGGSGRYPLYAFGRVVGFLSGWLSWLATVLISPIETVASLRYASHYLPWLTESSGGTFRLTGRGLLVAAGILLVFTLLNLIGVRAFRETNRLVVIFKLAVPVAIALLIMVLAFHPANFVAHGGFLPNGVHGVLLAVSQGGIGFALLGFEQAVQLGGETRDPQRSIPWAVVGSVVVATVVYVLLQLAFTGSLSPAELAHGWSGLEFHAGYGPFAGLVVALGAGWAVYLIYLAASISPAGTSLTYATTSSRVPFALSREGYLPPMFGRLNKRGVPVVPLVACYLCEIGLLLVAPRWRDLLAFATGSLAFIYALAPLSLAVLRRTAPEQHRPYRLAHHHVLGRIAFVVANLMFYWCGWFDDSHVLAFVLGGGVLAAIMAMVTPKYRHHREEWVATLWLPLWVAGIGAVSFGGRYGGGRAVLPAGVDDAVIVVLALAVYQLAARLGIGIHRALALGERPIDRWAKTAALISAQEAADGSIVGAAGPTDRDPAGSG